MVYDEVVKGIFLKRPNRFIAEVLIDGEKHIVHVKNTGRCKELLIEGATVYLFKANDKNRKTEYDLIAVEKNIFHKKTIDLYSEKNSTKKILNNYSEKDSLSEKDGTEKSSVLVNIDSQIVNYVAEEWLKKGLLFSKEAVIRREYTYGSSRFDFYITDGERKVFLEVKGVTLENNGIASFPDAPTLRGIKHINELCNSLDEGYEAYILFVIQMKGIYLFKPNKDIHKDFANALSYAKKQGVNILCIDCLVTPDSITADKYIPIEL